MSTVIITGASSGIGAIAAARLSAQGWDVAVVGRNPERTRDVAASVGGTPFLADYDRLDDVRELAEALTARYGTIDVLANNAGGLVGRRGETEDGNERTIQHNHLAPFLLTNLLLPRLKASGGRVINTASIVNRFGRIRLGNLNGYGRPYLGGWGAYSNSKLATVLFTHELATRTGIETYSFHPGFVATSFGRDTPIMRGVLALSSSSQITPEQGAEPLVQLVSAPDIDAPSGTYFDGLHPFGATAKTADDPTLASELWNVTADMVGVVRD